MSIVRPLGILISFLVVLCLSTQLRAQTDEIAIEGELLSVEVTDLDSTKVSFSAFDRPVMSLPLRRIDFVIIQDADKYRRLQEAVPMFAPYLRYKDLRNGITDPEDLARQPIQGAVSFRKFYESKQTVTELLLPYKGRDMVYLSSLQYQKATRAIWLGIALNVVGTAIGTLTDGRVAQLGFGVAGLGFVGGLGGAAYYINRGAFYQRKASELPW